MRKVIRPEIPHSLALNAAKWTEDLMKEINEKGAYSEVGSEFKDKYRQDDVKDTLEKMYTCHCCYCESIIGINTYGRIEHLKPKSLPEFHQYSFDWNNLHWCCEICNIFHIYKGEPISLKVNFPAIGSLCHIYKFT